MKISDKQMKILSGAFFLIGAIVVAYTRNYNKTHESDPNNYGKWIGIFLFFAGMLLLMPWRKNKINKL